MISASNVYSHVRRDEPTLRGGTKEWERAGFFSVAEIRKSKGSIVTSYSDLANRVAMLGYRNHKYNLLFRGQNTDHLDRNERTKMYPSIYRPTSPRLTESVRLARFSALDKGTKLLSRSRSSLGVHSILKEYEEYYMAILQHYQLVRTPMLDLTQSLLVAASFALQGSATGFLYVLGMRHPHGSISHYIDDEIVLVKLQNVCPPEALRPHYLEGYLVGKLPKTSSKDAGDNFARCIIGKYLLDNSGGTFWGNGFRAVEKEILLPPDDSYLSKLKSILAADPDIERTP